MIQVIHKIKQPSPYLRTFLKEYLFFHFVADAGDSIPVKPFPANTEHCLVFYLHGFVKAVDLTSLSATIYPKIAINGSQPSPLNFHISPVFQLLSLEFQPGMLSRFLGLPLTEFRDVRVDAEAFLQPDIRNLHDRLANTSSYEEIIAIVENYLWRRISRIKTDLHPIDAVTRTMTASPVGLPVEKMAAEACLSISQFERRFTQLQGISPKLYIRINRFYAAYKLKQQNPDQDWLSIALQTGYHDYQHMVKDFKQFSGTTPNSLLLAQRASPDGIALNQFKTR